jgi:hypothetical protein
VLDSRVDVIPEDLPLIVDVIGSSSAGDRGRSRLAFRAAIIGQRRWPLPRGSGSVDAAITTAVMSRPGKDGGRITLRRNDAPTFVKGLVAG